VVAQSCLWSNQYDSALQEFTLLLREQPGSGATHMLIGEALDGLGRADDAIAELQAATAASPPEPNAHFGLGYLFWKERHDDEAEREFRAELDQGATNAPAAAYVADVLIHRAPTHTIAWRVSTNARDNTLRPSLSWRRSRSYTKID